MANSSNLFANLCQRLKLERMTKVLWNVAAFVMETNRLTAAVNWSSQRDESHWKFRIFT